MYYTYIIKSIKYLSRYVGSTDNVVSRVKEHNNGRCRYTKGRKPWILVYKEEFQTRGEAMNREKFLKTGQGRKYLDKVLR